MKGPAIYITSIQSCSWNEEVPHYNPYKALRWSSNFTYRNNRLILDNGAKVLSDSKYDIATDTQRIQLAKGVHASMKVRPLLIKNPVSIFLPPQNRLSV